MHGTDQLRAALADRYEIERHIGEGGMAVVYLARDVRHNRRVALKILKPELGAVLGVERFLAEIQVTANLQHPNLLPLFDSGEAGGLLFYVMPFVEGETLRARLDREKQLPVDEAVRIAVSIAGALAYAHQHGVIHRDLKPENILMQAGQPVIADFGIALAVSNAGGARITQTGLSLGTPQYMSPEQATGDRSIDGRTDVYSLAAMLYEMLSGDPPHTASTAQGIIAKVLTDRPRSLRTLRATVPAYIDAAVARGLEKLPADRWSGAQEFADALLGRVSTLSAAGVAPGLLGERRPWADRLRDPLVVVLGLVSVVAVGTAGWLATHREGTKTQDSATVRFTLTPDSAIVPVYHYTWSVVPSPDGQTVVYSALVRNHSMLVARRLSETGGRPIQGTEGGEQPVFSPDGKSLVFEADGKLKRVSLDGGTPVSIADAGTRNGADWAPGDVLVFGAEGGYNGLVRLPAAGGAFQPLTTVDTAHNEQSHLWPIVLADGRTIAFAIWGRAKTESRIALTSIDDGKVTDLGLAGIAPVGVFDGQLVYTQADGTVMAAPIDVVHRKVTGAPVPVLDSIVVCALCNGDAAIRVSRAGTLAYYRGAEASRLVWADRSGTTQTLNARAESFATPRLSPDGTRIAVAIGAAPDVWVLSIASGTFTRLTTNRSSNNPEWTDDQHLVIQAVDKGRSILRRIAADGSGQAEDLVTVEHSDGYSNGLMTPDRTRLLVSNEVDDFAGAAISMRDMATGATRLWQDHASAPRVSPDGRFVALEQQKTVHVRTLDGTTGIQVSEGPGALPVWSRDGTTLFYLGPSRMMVVKLATTPTLRIVSRDSLFDDRGLTLGATPGFDVAKDGRFLVTVPTSENMQVVVVTNWLAELRARTGRK